MAVSTPIAQRPAVGKLLAIVLAGAAVSVFLGVYGSVHDPTGEETLHFFFSTMLGFKSWFTTFALVFALVQILTALRLYDRVHVPRTLPGWWGDAHRLSGTLALLCSIPVAYHCLWSLGFDGGRGGTRVLIHSIVGCFLYGVFVVKVTSVRTRRLPGWTLPVVGGSVFAALVVIWLTSSLWFFTNPDFPDKF